MASKSLCHPCTRIESSSVKPAEKYCMDCEDFLCTECIRAHKGHKASMKHHLVELHLAASIPEESTTLKSCIRHPDYIMDFFCTYHDALCCRSCMADEHRSCDKVVPLETAAGDAKTSIVYGDVSGGMQQICSTYETIAKDREKNIQDVKNDNKRTRNKITDLKASIIDTINKLEKTLISDLDTMTNQSVDKLQLQQSETITAIARIKNHLQHLEFLIKNGSNTQVFLLLQKLKYNLKEEDTKLKELLPTLDTLGLTFTPPVDIFRDKKSLGTIETTSKQSNFKYNPLKETEAQIISTRSKPTIRSFKFDSEINMEWNVKAWQSGTTGIIITKDNKIIVCSPNVPMLKMYSTDGKYLDRCPLADGARDIAYNEKTEQIVATLRDRQSIKFVDNFKAGREVNVLGDTYGVAWKHDKLFLGGKYELYILQSDGKHLKTIPIGESDISYIHARNNILYLTDYNKVYSIQEDGTPICTFKSPDLLGPDGITTDHEGRVYVVGRWSNNMHRLSSDGTQSEIVLGETDGIKNPITFSFNRDYEKLFISNDLGRSLLVFNSVY